MKKLIIAEKPSQAEVYATTIGIVEKKNGYYVCKDNYIITWCYGHLVKLANDKTYTKKEKWEMTYLPLILNKQSFIYQSEEKHEKHIGIIKSLIDQSDLVINGTDADREGELIFRTIKKVTSFSKPFKRLWLNSLEASDVKKGLNNLIEYSNEVDKTIKTDIAKTSLAAELRQQFDWLVGVNGTQTMTL
ncbi:DNA topoisomerase III, partial [Hamiltosporidium magnivora]